MSSRCSWPKGQIVVIFALVASVLLGAVALGTDVAVFYFNWVQLQKAADASALAGATYLPSNPDLARSAASNYVEQNGVEQSEITGITLANDNLQIQVSLERTVPYYFGRLLGLSNGTVSATAVAGVQAACSASGLVPIGIQKGTSLTTYQDITLKLAPAQGAVGPGNWEPLAMGYCTSCDAGGSNYKSNIETGYPPTINVGDMITTETGNLVGPTQQGIDYRLNEAANTDPNGTDTTHALNDPRVIEVPIVDFSGINGNSQVPVYGFAELWVNSVDGNGNINAEFITQVAGSNNPGNCGSTIYGAVTPVMMQ